MIKTLIIALLFCISLGVLYCSITISPPTLGLPEYGNSWEPSSHHSLLW